MPDHELELSGKLGLPEFAGFAVRLEGRYKGSWTARGQRHVDEVSARAGLTAGELAERLEGEEQLRDLLWVTLERAANVADVDYAEVLARLVGAACDAAEIHEVDYLTRQVVKMEPLHFRALLLGWKFLGSTNSEVPPRAADWVDHRPFAMAEADEALGVSELLVESVLSQLTSDGFLVKGSISDFADYFGIASDVMPAWTATELTAETLKLAFPQLAIAFDTPFMPLE